MAYFTVFVDAGYLLSACATRVTGSSLRSGVRVDYARLVAGIVEQCAEVSGLKPLRVSWYDAPPLDPMDRDHHLIAVLEGVKLRLGRRSPLSREQKGVDVRLGLDLATAGRNRIADVMFLVSGDDDLAEAVEEAQAHGCRVILLAVGDQSGDPHGVAKHLHRTADHLVTLNDDLVVATVSRSVGAVGSAAPRQPAAPETPVATPSPAPSPAVLARLKSALDSAEHRPAPKAHLEDAVSEAVDLVVRTVIETQTANGRLAQIVGEKPYIPRDIDSALLVDLAHRLDDFDLSASIRHRLRDRFWSMVAETSPVDSPPLS